MERQLDLSAPCSEQSLQCGEAIAGSAIADARSWLLIEHRGAWPSDIADCELPAEARAWLTALGARHRRMRTQLIRRPNPALEGDDDELTVFVIKADEAPSVRRVMVASHAELPSLELDDWLSGKPGTAAPGSEGPDALYLVCTHGTRDRCCSRHGSALLAALGHEQLDGELWRSSHQGGHRFAATLLYLPRGLHYGRLRPEHAPELAAAHRRGELFDIAHYRGRTCWSRPVQTAEAWLRDELATPGFGQIELLSHALHESDRWSARFRALDGTLHTLTVAPRRGQTAFHQSCNASETIAASYYYVVRHEAQIA